ncbi:hypothetical protein R1flu_008867 [Riccia fluitans]|uniref:Uncharacterized protein n=1 Tax=Riccia fluitans TaxID=41844 RepID=A0ABD1Z0F1_9MARC
MELTGPGTFASNETWTEQDTISLIERVENLYDTIGLELFADNCKGRTKKNSKSRLSGASKRKFVELWVTYDLVLNHGFEMPTHFTDKILLKMIHFSEGEGHVDRANPMRTVPMECVNACIDDKVLLSILGVDLSKRNIGRVEETEEFGEHVSDHMMPNLEITSSSPEFYRRRKSKRLASKRTTSSLRQTSPCEEEEESESSEGNACKRYRLPNGFTGQETKGWRRSERLAVRKMSGRCPYERCCHS